MLGSLPYGRRTRHHRNPNPHSAGRLDPETHRRPDRPKPRWWTSRLLDASLLGYVRKRAVAIIVVELVPAVRGYVEILESIVVATWGKAGCAECARPGTGALCFQRAGISSESFESSISQVPSRESVTLSAARMLKGRMIAATRIKAHMCKIREFAGISR